MQVGNYCDFFGHSGLINVGKKFAKWKIKSEFESCKHKDAVCTSIAYFKMESILQI